MLELRQTNLWIVIDEEFLTVWTNKKGEPRKFKTSSEANDKAKKKLNVWTVVPIRFQHKFIQHEI